MSLENRLPKRPRTEASDAQGLPEHYEEFWLDDGNVVILARNVAFRVYRGLLVAQSTVFADMFASSTAKSDEMMDGCPVVRVSDSPEDFAELLLVLLPVAHRRFYRKDAWSCYYFDEVFAVIRLAHKYNIEDVQEQALFALREYTFNDDFEKWNEDREEPISVEGPCTIGAANLARLLDVPEMLLIALYKCLDLRAGMLDGWKRDDGSIEHLSQDVVRRCIDANYELSRASARLAYGIFRPEPSNKCKQRSRCEDGLRRTLAEFLKFNAEDTTEGFSVISPWENAFDGLGFGVCNACWQAIKEKEEAGRREIWDRFPAIFDVAAERWGRSVWDKC